jgi:hypothetical protein
MISPERSEARSEALSRVIGKAHFIDRVSERPDRVSLRTDYRIRYLYVAKRTMVAGLLGGVVTSVALFTIVWIASPISTVTAELLALLGFTIFVFFIGAYWRHPQSTAKLAGPGYRGKRSGHVWYADYRYSLRLDRELLQRRKRSHDLAVRSLHTCLLGYPLCLVLRDFRTLAESSGSKQASGGWLEYGMVQKFTMGEDESVDAKLATLLLALCPVVSVASPVQDDLFEGEPARIPKLELPDQGWEDLVRDLIDAAEWIVVIANRVTGGLSRELELIRGQRKQPRTLVITPGRGITDDLEGLLIATGYNVMNPSTEIEPEIPADFTSRASVEILEPEIAYSRLATTRMLNTLFMQAMGVTEPWIIIHDTEQEQEQRLEQLVTELTDADSAQQTAENRFRRWELLMAAADVSNELRHYMQSAILAERALKVMQEESHDNKKAVLGCLVSRDGMLAALINMHEYSIARNELVHQLDDLGVALGADLEKEEIDGFAQRAKLHLGRIDKESRQPVHDLEARLASLERNSGTRGTE